MGLVVAAIVVNRTLIVRERRASRRRSVEKYERSTRELNLTIRELDFLDNLSAYLEEPSKRHLLLTNPQTLAACVRAYNKDHAVSEKLLTHLQARLGFPVPDVPPARRSTRMFTAGTVVRMILPGGDASFGGTVSAQFPDSTAILVDAQTPEIGVGDEIQLYAGDFRGFIVFDTKVSTIRENEIRFLHSDVSSATLDLEKPVPVKLDVLVRADHQKGKGIPTQVVSLHARGARVMNPDRRFRKGDDLRLYFHRVKNGWRQVNAEVVSLEKRRRLMIVRFSHVKRNVWDDIVARPSAPPTA